jgi:hypothetical protein
LVTDDVLEVLNVEFKGVVSTPLSLKLLHCYSLLYLNGGQPKFCERSQRLYYNQLKIDGMKRAEKFDAGKERKYTPNWEGCKTVVATGQVLNSATITDEQIAYYLSIGILKPKDLK